jgi:phage portal protein BeeE
MDIRWMTGLFKRKAKTPAPEKATDKTREFARMAVPAQGARPMPAAWVVDRNEFVRHVKNSAHIAIGCIARRCAMQPPNVVVRKATKSGWEEQAAPLDHPLVQLLDRINPIHTLYDYLYYTVGWRLATGDSFAWKARNSLGMTAELWPIPSQWVHVIPSEKEFISQYVVEGVWGKPVYWDASDILHVSDPNLDWSGTGRYYGRPTLAAAGSYVDIEEAMLKRMLSWFQNYSPPGMVFSGAEGIGPQQIYELYAIMAEQHAMNETSGRPFVVPEGFKLETGAMTSPKEIDYASQLDTTLEHILAIFGVPKAIAGIASDYNRANFQASMLGFATTVVNPLLEHLSQHHTQSLAREFDEDLLVRFEPVTVDDAEQMRKNFESAARSGAATPNEIREHMLTLPAFRAGGDRPLVQSAQIEAPFGNVDESELEEDEAPETSQDGLGGDGRDVDRKPAEGNGKPQEAGEDDQDEQTATAKVGGNGDGRLDPQRQQILDTVAMLLKRRQQFADVTAKRDRL